MIQIGESPLECLVVFNAFSKFCAPLCGREIDGNKINKTKRHIHNLIIPIKKIIPLYHNFFSLFAKLFFVVEILILCTIKLKSLTVVFCILPLSIDQSLCLLLKLINAN